MLRESTQIADTEVNLSDVTEGLSDGTKIPNAEELVNFAEAIVSRDVDRIAETRKIVFGALGNDATVDAAAQCASRAHVVVSARNHTTESRS